jgi:hypothetical protein
MLRGLEAQRSWDTFEVLWGHSRNLPGLPCGTFGSLLGGLVVFLGLPGRHNENTCWLIDFYDDFGLVLGGSWEHLGRFLRASWRPLGELLGAFVAR